MSRADAIERACDTFVADGRPHNRTCDCADCQNYDAVAAALALPPDQITTDNSATLGNALARIADLEAALRAWEARSFRSDAGPDNDAALQRACDLTARALGKKP